MRPAKFRTFCGVGEVRTELCFSNKPLQNHFQKLGSSGLARVIINNNFATTPAAVLSCRCFLQILHIPNHTGHYSE